MKPGKGRSSWQALRAKECLLALVSCALIAGCQNAAKHVDENLMANGDRGGRAAIAGSYVIMCPDELEVSVPNHPEVAGPHAVGVDGRIDLMSLGQPRVEGETVVEIGRQVADLAGVPATQVRVEVAKYRAHCIYLFGEVNGSQRAVPYVGQETVLDLLRRTGGITQGAAPDEVYVVRTHVDDNQRPEVFHVDLTAIVLKHDDRTNVRLEPFDQVHVGATRRASLVKCMPPWLRPTYERICGWLPLPRHSAPQQP
jgi:protein involved in polysaccharide export with SLBB domain